MKQLLLHIPTPCSESWSDMHPVSNGRFCDHCQKTVVDFSTMSDPEIYAYFKKRNDKVCGRFLDTQLNREVIPLLRRPYFPVVPAMLIGACFVMAIPESGKAQMGKPVAAKVMPVQQDSTTVVGDVVDLNEVEVVAYAAVKRTYVTGGVIACVNTETFIAPPKKRKWFARFFKRKI